MTGNIVIYQTKDNHIEVTIDDKNETIWLNKNDIANLFSIDRSGVSRHISNIFKSAELDFKSNVQKMHIANSDKPVEFYNLDIKEMAQMKQIVVSTLNQGGQNVFGRIE